MKFVVNRKTWYRGQGTEYSKLLREDGTRCCIGFVAQQCGVPDHTIRNVGTIYYCSSSNYPWPAWFNEGLAVSLTEAYIANDSLTLNEQQREQQITEIFVKHGDEIVFID